MEKIDISIQLKEEYKEEVEQFFDEKDKGVLLFFRFFLEITRDKKLFGEFYGKITLSNTLVLWKAKELAKEQKKELKPQEESGYALEFDFEVKKGLSENELSLIENSIYKMVTELHYGCYLRGDVRIYGKKIIRIEENIAFKENKVKIFIWFSN